MHLWCMRLRTDRIYMLQEFCRRVGLRATDTDISGLIDGLARCHSTSAGKPAARGPDFQQEAGLADALLHPQDRAYSVPQLFDFLEKGGLRFSDG